MRIIYILEKTDTENNVSIYLAGPTYREFGHYQKSWRRDTLKILREKNFDGIVYIPEPRNSIQSPEWTYSRQIDWELDAMKEATVVLFWIPRDLENLPAFTTNTEFGEWMKSGKIVVGAPPDSPKNEYIRERCSRLNIPWSTNLSDCISNALQRTKKLAGVESKTWFTADTHFGHHRTLELSRRPFISVGEMDWQIVANWNKIVGENDIVYHLGDFGDPKVLKWLVGKSIKFLPGNYDSPDVILEIEQYLRVEIIGNNHLVSLDEKHFKLIHEPEKADNKDDFYLFGHIHKLQMVKKNGLNVGMDCHNFCPVSVETILFYRNAILNHYDENVFGKHGRKKSLSIKKSEVIE